MNGRCGAQDIFHDHKLIASRIDFFADALPHKIVASVPISASDASQGYRNVTVKAFARAIDRAARWMDNALSQCATVDSAVEIFAYDGPVDLRWLILLVAAIKTSRTIVLSLTYTSTKNLKHLYQGCNCKTLLHASFEGSSPAIDELKDANFFEVIRTVPELSDFLGDETTDSQRYPYTKNWEEAAGDNIVYFQSSGTTGPPKPIPHTNASLLHWFNMRVLAEEDPRLQLSIPPGHRIHCGFHISHVSGCWWTFLSMIYWDTITVFGPPHNVATPDIVKSVLKNTTVHAATYPPALLTALTKDAECLSLVRALQCISTGGSVLDDGSATKIFEDSGCRVQNNFGSTEMMIIPVVRLPQEAWPYLRFHPCAGIAMQPCTEVNRSGPAGSSETIYEFVVIRDPLKFEKGYQPVFHLFPQNDEYHSRDLFKRHPTQSELWMYYGRVDDMLVLPNAHSVFVGDMQRAIQGHPAIAAAIIGSKENQLFALVELHPQDYKRFTGRPKEEAVDAIWPAMESANKLCATTDRITKNTVILCTPDKPVRRLGKLSVDRRGTISLYQDEVDKIAG